MGFKPSLTAFDSRPSACSLVRVFARACFSIHANCSSLSLSRNLCFFLCKGFIRPSRSSYILKQFSAVAGRAGLSIKPAAIEKSTQGRILKLKAGIACEKTIDATAKRTVISTLKQIEMTGNFPLLTTVFVVHWVQKWVIHVLDLGRGFDRYKSDGALRMSKGDML